MTAIAGQQGPVYCQYREPSRRRPNAVVGFRPVPYHHIQNREHFPKVRRRCRTSVDKWRRAIHATAGVQASRKVRRPPRQEIVIERARNTRPQPFANTHISAHWCCYLQNRSFDMGHTCGSAWKPTTPKAVLDASPYSTACDVTLPRLSERCAGRTVYIRCKGIKCSGASKVWCGYFKQGE